MTKLAKGTRLRSKDRREQSRIVEIVGHTQDGYAIRTVIDARGVAVENGRRSLVRTANLLKPYEPEG